MTDATLDTTGPKPAVRLERRLPDPPAVVWRAITERDQLKAWFPCDVIVEDGRWEAGAAITFPPAALGLDAGVGEGDPDGQVEVEVFAFPRKHGWRAPSGLPR